jgi:muconate cycloisomerase
LNISKIEIFPLRVPLKRSFRNAHVVRSHQDSIVLRIKTEGGLVGVGNVDPDPGYSEEGFSDTLAAVQKLSEILTGMDPFNVAAVLERMDQVVPSKLDAKAAIEMALFDLKGKALGVPVHSLLGGMLTEEIYLNGWIGMVSPDEAATEARVWLDHGFRSAKIKLGSGLEQDRDRVKAVREAVGNKMALRVDANEAYTVDESIRLAKLLSPFDIALFEQPVSRRDLSGMANVRNAIEIPLMADEAILGPETLVEVIKKEAADIVKVKVMKQGGLTRTVQMIQMAEAAGIRCVIGHGFGLAINTLSEIHVAATCKNILEGCEFVGPLKLKQDIVKNPLDMENGKVRVPTGPGLGAEIDEDKLKSCILS